MTRSTNSSYLPKIGRQPKAVNFVLTERDLMILNALGRYRFMRTGQISQLIFPKSKTVQSARRRLKYLYHAGYAGRIQAMTESALGQAEMAYYLEPAGADLLDADDLPRFSRKGMVKPLFLRHALAVSEFRMQLELSAQKRDDIDLHRVVMDYELKSHTENALGRRRYRLFDEVLDPIGKRKFVVHPDMMFVLRSDGPDNRVFQKLYFVEIDRGTEGLRVIADKLTGYHLYRRERVFSKFGDFDGFRVLIQTNSEKRACNIATLVERHEKDLDAWVCTDRDLLDSDLLSAEVWSENLNAQALSILKVSSAKTASDSEDA